MGNQENGQKGFQWITDMKTYTIRRHGDRYKIYEGPTKTYIVSYKDKDHARATCEKLNAGAGFMGKTPPFFSRNLLMMPIPSEN